MAETRLCEECVRKNAQLKVFDGALAIAAEMAVALKPLIPDPDTLDPKQRELWQRVINAVFAATDYADKHDLVRWGGKISNAN